MARDEGLVVFPDGRSLLLALHYALPRNQQFPGTVVVPDGGGVAVPGALLGGEIDALAALHGWTLARRGRRPADRETPISALLASAGWRRAQPSGTTAEAGGSEATLYDRHHAQTRYLLAARDEAGAARLLEVLTGFLVSGIRALPVTVEGGGAFPFFWLVDGPAPMPAAVLRCAARAFWGPIAHHDELWTLKQWPLDLALPDALLARMPWGKGPVMVLLSRDEPRVLTLRPGASGRPWQELVEVAALEVGGITSARFSAAPQNRTRFRVRLELIPKRRSARLEQRIVELRHEIRAKEAALSALEEQLERQPRETLTRQPQPLYLYAESDGETIPEPLRRLLIDWGGQSEEIEALRYAKLDGRSLPPAAAIDAHLHLLTTSAAVSAPGREQVLAAPDVAFRLLEYAPRRSGTTRFELVPAWAAAGLALFVPAEQSLELYPEIAITPLNATILASALLGTAALRSDHAAVLFPSAAGLMSWRIPRAAFRPLTDERGWSCALDVEPLAPHTVHILATEAGAKLLAALAAELTRAAEAERAARLEPVRQELQRTLDADASALAQARRALADLSRRIREFGDVVKGAPARLASVYRTMEEACKELARVAATPAERLRQLKAATQLEQSAAQEAAKLTEPVAALERGLTELRRELAQALGSRAEGPGGGA